MCSGGGETRNRLLELSLMLPLRVNSGTGLAALDLPPKFRPATVSPAGSCADRRKWSNGAIGAAGQGCAVGRPLR